jgi:hypothetical protein
VSGGQLLRHIRSGSKKGELAFALASMWGPDVRIHRTISAPLSAALFNGTSPWRGGFYHLARNQA